MKQIEEILRQWLFDSQTGEFREDELVEDMELMKNSLSSDNERKYYVATTNDKVIGVVGMQPVYHKLEKFVQGKDSVEVINLYVDKNSQGLGVGKALMTEIEEASKSFGHDEILLWSGPRFKDTAWGFYDHLEGWSRAGIVKTVEGYGDFPAWRKKVIKK
ncbi:MAG: GNAT family N-acetyltransferase [Candidatus Berkelbacteria bacterium]